MKVIAKISNALGVGILLLVIIIAAALLISQAAGVKPMAVLSGSMEPSYHVGGVVFINTHTSPDTLKTGDVVTYTFSGDTVVTHRIVSVDAQARTFVTKGDANEDADGAVSFDQFVGKAAKLYLPLLGYVLLQLGTKKGLGIGLIFVAFIVILFIIPVLLKPNRGVSDAAEA
ncbi:MAG: signal peptidase I [Clostridiales Family XIII bacterium]|nr:signal peptidase I [Clostridiales Family XIII bacterium]